MRCCGKAVAAAFLALLIPAPAAFAHDGPVPTPGTLWTSWSWDPFVLAGLTIAVWLYLRGLRVLWRRASRGRGIGWWRVIAYFSGLAVIFGALISPVDTLSEVLFSAHMGQHMLLLEVAAPLLVLGLPQTAWFWALPLPTRRDLGMRWHHARHPRRIWAVLTKPLVATTLFVLVIWLWHAPALYDAALQYDAIHALEHATFLGAAMLFWWRMLPMPGRPRADAGGGVLCHFAAATLNGLLAALLIFSTVVWYTPYVPYEAAWGLNSFTDQQLAGLVMWIPMGAIHAAMALSLIAIWLRALEERVGIRETAVRTPTRPGAAPGDTPGGEALVLPQLSEEPA